MFHTMDEHGGIKICPQVASLRLARDLQASFNSAQKFSVRRADTSERIGRHRFDGRACSYEDHMTKPNIGVKRPPVMIALAVAPPMLLFADESVPPAAWQRGDAGLATKWELLTGKFIYQRACTSCHTWGPAYWPRSRWEAYLKAFPGEHQPDVVERYKDLTAMFDAGKMVPTLKPEGDALTKFIMAAAPSGEAPAERLKPFEGFPEVGKAAPDFSITDVRGRAFSLAQLKDKKAFVLVFSRAHW